jgi:predicted permease
MDFRYAARSLRKNPGFTLLAVFVMALGIGANTAVFSVVNSVLLKPLDYPEADRIVTVTTYWKNTGDGRQVSAPDFHDWHDHNNAFAALAYYAAGETSVFAGGNAEYAHVSAVTPEFLDVFGVRPLAGRFFNADETKPQSGGAALISYGLWQSHYGGASGAMGHSLRVQDRSLAIVGVLPPGFQFPDKTDIWIPANTIFPETTSRGAHNYLAVGRLKPGVSIQEAQQQLAAVAARLERQFPRSNRNKSVRLTPMRESMVRNVRPTLFLLLGGVAVVLLIACGNVANLLLAKATSRSREIAVRAAMGAGRWRIARMLAIESLLLAVLSAAAGLLLADWGATAMVALAPANVPRLQQTAIDGSVLAFTLLSSFAAMLIFGLAPAIRASRVDLNEALKQGAARAMGGGAGRLRSGLVVAEIALSVVLLAAAGLLVKSFLALNQVPLGFHPEHVLVMDTDVPANGKIATQHAMQFYGDLLAQAAAMPGVSAAGGTRIPPGHIGSNGGYWLPGEEPGIGGPEAVFSVITPGALAALGIPLQAGRDFDGRDTADAPLRILVNEALVRRSFPGQNPLGRTLRAGFDRLDPMEIVGVVGNIRQGGPASEPWPEIYMPYLQHPGASTALSVVVRTAGDPTALADRLRQRARQLAPDVPMKFTTLEASLAENVAAPRFRTLLFGIFAAVAVLLAMAGVYGVMAYAVGQRANEIGLRMALGASPGNVLGLVLRQGLRLTALGLAIGLVGGVAATRLLGTMLFAVKPTDPLTYAAVAVVLTLVAAAACYAPARRAMRLDPMAALRQD